MLGDLRGIYDNFIECKKNLKKNRKICTYDLTGIEFISGTIWFALMVFTPFFISGFFPFTHTLIMYAYMGLLLFDIITTSMFFIIQKGINNNNFQSQALFKIIVYSIGIFILSAIFTIYYLWLEKNGLDRYVFLSQVFLNPSALAVITFIVCSIFAISSVVLVVVITKQLNSYSNEVRQLTYYGDGELFIKPLPEDELITKLIQVYPYAKNIRRILQIIYIIIMSFIFISLYIMRIDYENIIAASLIILSFMNYFADMTTTYIVMYKNNFMQSKVQKFNIIPNILSSFGIVVLLLVLMAFNIPQVFIVLITMPFEHLGPAMIILALPMFLFGPIIMLLGVIISILIFVASLILVIWGFIQLGKFQISETNKVYNSIVPELDSVIISKKVVTKPVTSMK